MTTLVGMENNNNIQDHSPSSNQTTAIDRNLFYKRMDTFASFVKIPYHTSHLFPALHQEFDQELQSYFQEEQKSSKSTLEEKIQIACKSLGAELTTRPLKNIIKDIQDLPSGYSTHQPKELREEFILKAMAIVTFLDYIKIKDSKGTTYSGVHAAARENLCKCLRIFGQIGNLFIPDSNNKYPAAYVIPGHEHTLNIFDMKNNSSVPFVTPAIQKIFTIRITVDIDPTGFAERVQKFKEELLPLIADPNQNNSFFPHLKASFYDQISQFESEQIELKRMLENSDTVVHQEDKKTKLQKKIEACCADLSKKQTKLKNTSNLKSYWHKLTNSKKSYGSESDRVILTLALTTFLDYIIQEKSYVKTKGRNSRLSYRYCSGVHLAAYEGMLKCLNFFYRVRGDLNIPDSHGHFPIHYVNPDDAPATYDFLRKKPSPLKSSISANHLENKSIKSTIANLVNRESYSPTTLIFSIKPLGE